MKVHRSILTLLAIVVLVAMAALPAGCAANDEPAQTPADTGSPVTDEGEPEQWEEAAAETLEGACTQCHEATRVFLTPYGNWNATITRMEEAHGAVLTEEEKATITRFLDERTPTPAELVIKDKCTTCHDVGRIYEQPQGDWDALVKRMVEVHEAPLTPEEQQLVIEYLNESYKTTE